VKLHHADMAAWFPAVRMMDASGTRGTKVWYEQLPEALLFCCSVCSVTSRFVVSCPVKRRLSVSLVYNSSCRKEG
jgi:hypothetical protein